jgi:hypothetical protein
MASSRARSGVSVPRCRDVSRQIGTLANRVSRRLKNYAPAGTLETIDNTLVSSSVPVSRPYIEGKSGTLDFSARRKRRKPFGRERRAEMMNYYPGALDDEREPLPTLAELQAQMRNRRACASNTWTN